MKNTVFTKNGQVVDTIDVKEIHKWRWRAISIWIFIFTIMVGVSLYEIAVAPRKNCERISRQITKTVSPNSDNLGKRGSPGYSYYLAHPDELKVAKEQAQKLKRAFDPSKCR